MSLLRRSLAVLLLLLVSVSTHWGYSVLTHEQIVDVLWKDGIQPLLLRRFPNSTEEDLRKAHGFAYGGCVLQDMGYYPFGSKYFSDLVHYVRSGDFVEALIRDSSDLNEYAFALGDPTINRVTAIEFPKLARKFGPNVTYANDPKAHIQTEFGFDMVQVAKNRYTSDHYHDFIGFEVSSPLLKRAFLETYDLKLEDVFGDVDLAIGSYRRSVSRIIPEMTRVALLSRREQLVKDTPNFNKKQFLFYLSRAQYEKQWGSVYRKPGLGSRILAFFLKIIPKVGPFKAVDFKIPTQQTEDMYIKSVDLTVQDYTGLLHQIHEHSIELKNIDFDTGRDTRAGEYVLTDKTYARLVEDLAKKRANPIAPELRADILQFYSNPNAPLATKKKKKDWQKLQQNLAKLQEQKPEATPRPSPQ
ncbi:MAG: hypothetical protein DMG90_04745 [Acidobacteria bacterium]|nr:MAG: hypothetical protein DMG90_04745 [Acidobacteriota bacterium]